MHQEHLREEAAKVEAAQRQAATVQQEEQRRARRQREDEISRQVRDRELRDLRLKVTKQEWWKNQVEAATRNVARQEYNSLMAELEKAINAQSAPLTKPSPNFATLYRQNQRSGWYYVEDSDE